MNKKHYFPITLICNSLLLSLGMANSHAAGIPGLDIEEVLVSAKQRSLQGEASSASVGTVSRQQLEYRPMFRPAEILETVPGLVVTQHSGDGKANQYFLRGFNLDHGTDFSTYVDGMPVNMVTHGHGQGYSDLNFLIPELVGSLSYRKGPYYARESDFSTAGSGRIQLLDSLDEGHHSGKGSGKISVTLGEDNYRRTLLVQQFSLGEGRVIAGLEWQQTDGPWKLEEDLRRRNALVRYLGSTANTDYGVTLMLYDAEWTATDQIPERLVNSGQLDRFGFVSDGSGGDTHRYSLSFNGETQWDVVTLQSTAYLIDYDLSLTSNPTYFVNDPLNGDEFTQFDNRTIWGGELNLAGDLSESTRYQTGVKVRYDKIDDVGFGNSRGGSIYQTVMRDSVDELASGVYVSLETLWTSWFASDVGLRYDLIDADVSGRGGDNDSQVSPKISLRFGPWNDTEYFINYGLSFHSNDVRGVVADSRVPLIAEGKGAEVGFRTGLLPNAQISVALFALELDSELVFVGDDGTTEPKGATRRSGVEVGVYYQPLDWLIIDVDYSKSKARFKSDPDDIGRYVPDSVEEVASLGLTAELPAGWHAGLRWRYFGPRALVEDNSVRSDSTSIININAGYQFNNGLALRLELINVLDKEDDDVTYLFESLTAQERAASLSPVEDRHFHPTEPRTMRLNVSYEF